MTKSRIGRERLLSVVFGGVAVLSMVEWKAIARGQEASNVAASEAVTSAVSTDVNTPSADANRPAGPNNVRPIDGAGNNVAHRDWGTPNSHLVRGPSGTHYGDGLSTLAGATRPSPRAVSNAFFSQSGSIPAANGMSDFIWTWGQFLDHDLSLTEGAAESAPFAIPTGDAFFDPQSTGSQTMSFHRGAFDPATGTTTPRQQINEITGYIDGSMVYGSTPERARWLRTLSGGKLKVTKNGKGDLLPFNDGTVPNAGSPESADLSTALFVAGDIRANEQPTLACIHTLFVREHNRVAEQLASQTRNLSDEQLYQRARAIVIGEIQKITFDEFLPVLLGKNALRKRPKYDPQVNAGVNAVFSGAGYRLGHTLLSPQLQRLDENGKPVAGGAISLRDMFFNAVAPMLTSDGIEPFLRGVAAQTAQELDEKVIEDVRSFLFGAPGQGGLDLTALNIQRGRDLALPDFNTIRKDYGLARKSNFSQITSDPAKVAKLKQTYASVDDIDAFAGLLIEDDYPGAIVGETLRAVLVDQFERSRSGDRFWYESTLNSQDLSIVEGTKLSDVIKRNTSIANIQRNAFYVRSVRASNED